MSTAVQEKTIKACAHEVHAASQDMWEEAETAAATAAARKARSLGASEIKQQAEATKARHDTALARTPLVWEVFERPGRWRGKWEMAPAFPDGRLGPDEQARAIAEGNLVVGPMDTEEDIARRLSSLLEPTTGSV